MSEQPIEPRKRKTLASKAVNQYKLKHAKLFEKRSHVIVELDQTFKSPLLNQMFKPTKSNSVKFYQNKQLRRIIIESPLIAIKAEFGELLIQNVISLFTREEFEKFIKGCYVVWNISENYSSFFQGLEKSDDVHKIKLKNIILNNFEQLPFIPTDPSIAKHVPNYLLPKLVNIIVEMNPSTISYLAKDGFAYLNRELILKIVSNNPYSFKYLPNDLKFDREIVLVAVKKKGCCLKFTPEEMKCDREIVLAAVNQDGDSYEYAAKELQLDREIALIAIKNSIFGSCFKDFQNF